MTRWKREAPGTFHPPRRPHGPYVIGIYALSPTATGARGTLRFVRYGAICDDAPGGVIRCLGPTYGDTMRQVAAIVLERLALRIRAGTHDENENVLENPITFTLRSWVGSRLP